MPLSREDRPAWLTQRRDRAHKSLLADGRLIRFDLGDAKNEEVFLELNRAMQYRVGLGTPSTA
jgi:hypothetical protein